jgi:hypothetical protein
MFQDILDVKSAESREPSENGDEETKTAADVVEGEASRVFEQTAGN